MTRRSAHGKHSRKSNAAAADSSCSFCSRTFASITAVGHHQRDSEKCAELSRQAQIQQAQEEQQEEEEQLHQQNQKLLEPSPNEELLRVEECHQQKNAQHQQAQQEPLEQKHSNPNSLVSEPFSQETEYLCVHESHQQELAELRAQHDTQEKNLVSKNVQLQFDLLQAEEYHKQEMALICSENEEKLNNQLQESLSFLRKEQECLLAQHHHDKVLLEKENNLLQAKQKLQSLECAEQWKEQVESRDRQIKSLEQKVAGLGEKQLADQLNTGKLQSQQYWTEQVESRDHQIESLEQKVCCLEKQLTDEQVQQQQRQTLKQPPPSQRQQQKLCARQGCNRPVWVKEGFSHKFCGRTHASEALKCQNMALPLPHGRCHKCLLPECEKPVFVEPNGRVHDFCGRKHAIVGQGRGLLPKSAAEGANAAEQVVCSYPLCKKPRFRDNRGFLHDFCGRTHAIKAKTIRLGPVPEGLASKVERVWKGRPGEAAYTLSVLTKEHDKYAGVVEQLKAAWLHSEQKPTVLRVLQLRNADEVYARYSKYKTQISPSAAGSAETEVRRFHGTGLAKECNFGIDVSKAPCQLPHCAVCSICASSFALRCAGTGPNAQNRVRGLRYGSGLYFSKVSSKSNDYAKDTEREHNGKPVRCMFLCKVAVGSVHYTDKNELTEPEVTALVKTRNDNGQFDCIVGRGKADGGPLNYQETVVYSNYAAIPSYLIVYELPS